jgi:aminopeptidase N
MTSRDLVVIAFTALLAVPSRTSALELPRFSFDATPGALSKDVVPSRYRLLFDLDPGRDTFAGEAAIVVRVRKAASSIGLHARELEASSAFLVDSDGARRPLRITHVEGSVGWRLETDPPAPIPVGDYTIEISYTGNVQTAGEGLFVARYRVNGKPEAMLATQLQPIDARRLFPCFDEPAFRAVFEISVKAPARYEAVSNMPVSDRAPGSEVVTHRFLPTPPMPTYLVAIAVGRFESLPGEAAGVPLRILTTEGRREKGRFALEVTNQVIPFYSAYFGVPYALPKLDQLAVAAVRAGAMEDWGLISYSEDLLLFDPATSNPGTQRAVFSAVAHEVAHQWFGDLVTPASWDEIWLNEAFATWMKYKAAARFHPEWRTDLEARIAMEQVMERDAGSSTRSIRSGPVRESSVNEVFDGVTYTKGGAVLSMLEQWIGPDALRRGLASYVRERRLSNATAGDLWHHLSRAAGKDVAAVATTWTDQEGFPLVEVSSRCIAGQTRVDLAQRRFSLGKGELPPHVWKVPIQLSRGKDRRTFLLDQHEKSIVLPGCSKAPLLANAGGIGFYRVEYAAPDFRRLADAFVALSPADRATLLGDTFALAQAGRTPMASYFSLLAALPSIQDESRNKLFTLSFMALGFLDDAMAGTPAQASVRRAGRALLAPALRGLGWKPEAGESGEITRLRGSLIVMLAGFGDPAVVETAERLVDADLAGTTPLPPSIRSSIFQALGFQADRARFDGMVSLLRSSSGEEERQMYALSLAGNRDPERARSFLALSLSGELPPNVSADIPGLVGLCSENGALAYAFTLEHWGELDRLAGEGGRAWLLPMTAWRFNDLSWARRLQEDQLAKAGPDSASVAARASSRIELRALVRQRDAAALEQYLATWAPRR